MLFKSKKKRFIEKLMNYGANWDTEDYGYVILEHDGRMIRTNNKAKTKLCLNKQQLFNLVSILQSNT